MRVSDLTLPEGVTTEVDADEQIAIASITRAAEAEAVPEGAEGEGEGDEGAEGAEGADGAEASASGDAE